MNGKTIIITPEKLGEFDPSLEDIQQLEKLPQIYLSPKEKKAIEIFNKDIQEQFQQEKRLIWLNSL